MKDVVEAGRALVEIRKAARHFVDVREVILAVQVFTVLHDQIFKFAGIELVFTHVRDNAEDGADASGDAVHFVFVVGVAEVLAEADRAFGRGHRCFHQARAARRARERRSVAARREIRGAEAGQVLVHVVHVVAVHHSNLPLSDRKKNFL